MSETGALDSEAWSTTNRGWTTITFATDDLEDDGEDEVYSLEYDFTFKTTGGANWEPELILNEKALGYGPSS